MSKGRKGKRWSDVDDGLVRIPQSGPQDPRGQAALCLGPATQRMRSKVTHTYTPPRPPSVYIHILQVLHRILSLSFALNSTTHPSYLDQGSITWG